MATENLSTPFFTDRAKGGRAGCKGCKQKCLNGELRIAKIVHNPYSEDNKMKSWYHLDCLMNAFLKQRPTTKRIESINEIGNWENLNAEDQKFILDKINETEKLYADKHDNKFPLKVLKNEYTKAMSAKSPNEDEDSAKSSQDHVSLEDNKFRLFISLCNEIAREDSYLGKTAIVNRLFTKGSDGKGFKGDITLWCSLLLPQAVKRVYNLKSKQLVKLFSRIFSTDHDDMLTHLENGDISDTVVTFYELSSTYKPQASSNLSIQDIDKFLQKLSMLTKEDEQIFHFKTIIKSCSSSDLKYLIRLIKGDLRINAGPKHILEGVHPDAYSVFQTSRDINMVISRVLPGVSSVKHKDLSHQSVEAKVNLMTPVLPMLAEACKSVEMAMKKCPNGMFSEIKYDGERVQVHKKGNEFKYFSRALKPVMAHKVSHFKDYIPQAFPLGDDLILDAEVLMVDLKTSKPLPFGSLGAHKKHEFKDAQVCLFVFDCIYYNGKVLIDKPIRERRRILQEHMVEVKNHIMLSEQELIRKPADLACMIVKVLQLGLEGLVLKDLESKYEPGKRHWLKVKKDYLFDGAMADTADLVVLGAWFGSGKKGGMMSVFLMGCYDKRNDQWLTVTKVHTGHDDKTLEKLQDTLGKLMVKISQDSTRVPAWLKCTNTMVPDFVARDPKMQPVWEITGTEFTKANIHTANGISVRFPRVTRIRSDKNWQTATNLEELKVLFETSKEKTDYSLLNKVADVAEDNSSTSSSKKTTPAKKNKETKGTKIDKYFTSKVSPKETISKQKIDYEDGVDIKKENTLENLTSQIKKEDSSPPTTMSSKKRKNEDDDDINMSRKVKIEKFFFDKNSDDEINSKVIEKINEKVMLLPNNPLPNVFENYSLAFFPDYISFPEKERQKFERHWIAYGGKIVKSFRSKDTDFVVHWDKSIGFTVFTSVSKRFSKTSRHVTKQWFIDSHNRKELLDHRLYSVSIFT